MCGLVGIAGKITTEEDFVFRNLLLLDVIRGPHSTGLLRVPSTAVAIPTVSKELGGPVNLMGKSFVFGKGGRSIANSTVLMGHNRFATMGKIDEAGAHPFRFGDIIGAHNGTLRDWYDLEGFLDFDIDSQAIFKDISVNGIDHTWKSFEGAAALTWWDDGDKTLNLVRNKERPLYLAYINDGSAIVWASEKWMIKSAIAYNNNIKLDEEKSEKLPNPFLLAEHSLHSFSFDKVTNRPFLTECRKLKFKEPQPKKKVGFPTIIGGNSNNSSGVQPKGKFNNNWAKGMGKGDKSFKGTRFKVVSSVLGAFYKIKGVTLEGENIVIYPSSFEQWNELKIVPYDDRTKDNVYQVTHRPRVKKLSPNSPTMFCIGGEGFELIDGFLPKHKAAIYINANNKACSREEAVEDLHMAGNQCCYCCADVQVSDNYMYIFNGDAVLCNDCLEDENTSLMFGI